MEYLTLLVLGYSLYRLANLDYLQRMAGILGFLCGATFEARNLALTITFGALTKRMIVGFVLTAVLFRREIGQLLR
jgi:hypothetical protein